MTEILYDTSLGCIMGALVGDAAGATLEFLGRIPTLAEVDRAMTMPGGGVWQVAPGQITDDGELTLCLLQALSESTTFDLEAIARQYARWIDSDPFDIGNTTASSLGSYSEFGWKETFEQQGYAAVMVRAASDRCMGSKANGSLMRISPLGVWGYRCTDEALADFARQDSSLSHPNLSCRAAAACYSIAIASLMRQPGAREAAFNRAKQWLETQLSKAQPGIESHCYREVRGWLQDAENNADIPYSPHIGFVKIAFTHAFRHLLLGSDYVTALRETLSGGGDTDTNACIVGGLIGAACGAQEIPETMQRAVLQCQHVQGHNPRPQFLHPAAVLQWVRAICDRNLANFD